MHAHRYKISLSQTQTHIWWLSIWPIDDHHLLFMGLLVAVSSDHECTAAVAAAMLHAQDLRKPSYLEGLQACEMVAVDGPGHTSTP